MRPPERAAVVAGVSAQFYRAAETLTRLRCKQRATQRIYPLVALS